MLPSEQCGIKVSWAPSAMVRSHQKYTPMINLSRYNSPSVVSVGNFSVVHVSSRSCGPVVAGKDAGVPTAGCGTGTTAEQLTRSAGLWPRTASFLTAFLKAMAMASCSFTKPCQAQAVRSSRARAKSDWRRSSPTSVPSVVGRGEETSPVLLFRPGKPTPLSRTSRKI